MDWSFILGLILGFGVGSLIGFAFGWLVFERFRAKTLHKHLEELRDIDDRLRVINDKITANDITLTPAEMAEFLSAKRLEKPKARDL